MTENINETYGVGIFQMTSLGERAFREEFERLNEWEPLGPMARTLVGRMKTGELAHVDTCLPKDMEGVVLQECLTQAGNVWNWKYVQGDESRQRWLHSRWKDLSRRWLVNAIREWIECDPIRRVCIVLDTCCFRYVAEDGHQHVVERFYRNGDGEGYLFLGATTPELVDTLMSCLYYGFDTSSGSLVTLPDDMTLNDLLNMGNSIPGQVAEMLATRTDGVYLNVYDGLSFMIGWFQEIR